MMHAMLIDDDEDYRNLLVRKLKRVFPRITLHEIDPLKNELPGEDYAWEQIDCIILDYDLRLDKTGLDWYKSFKVEEMPATILLTARGSEELAVRSIKLGIDDYMVKGHFSDEGLFNSINECVYNKRLERARMRDLTQRSAVFNKTSFIRRLGLITREKDTQNHLLMFNPEAFQGIGTRKGLIHQHNYINYIADRIYQYLHSRQVYCNILVYREEYIAVIIETKSYQRYLKQLYKMLSEDDYVIDYEAFPCSVNVGVISPRSLEAADISKNDFEILAMAQVLCESAKSSKKNKICLYGDVNLKDMAYLSGEPLPSSSQSTFDFERAIQEGRVSANYQPWIYISTDETINLKDIHDVRVQTVDESGKKISHNELTELLQDTYARRVVDRWVLRNTVSQLSEIASRSGKRGNIKLTAKVTLSSVTDMEFLPWLRKLLDDADIPQGSLMLEIEAPHYIRNPEPFQLLMRKLGRDYKVKFILSAIYQINTYYQIRQTQYFDYIKINVKDLIFGFPRNPLNELIETIRKDECKIIAINVDDAEMLSMATEFDIDYVHGYLVGKPYINMISDSDGDLYYVM